MVDGGEAVVPEVGVQVVGGGVAGCELAWGLASAGRPTRLLSTSLDTLYTLPAERWAATPPEGSLWALLGAEAADAEGQQRAYVLRRAVKRELERLPALQLLQSNVTGLLWDEGRGAVLGVRTWEGPERRAPLTVLAVGSFLRARLRVGRSEEKAGRMSEMAYDDLADELAEAGVVFERRRLEAAESALGPGYVVDFDAFSEGELAPWAPGAVHAGSGRSHRWRGLGAVGVCASELDLEATARAGRDLAAQLLSSGDA